MGGDAGGGGGGCTMSKQSGNSCEAWAEVPQEEEPA